MGQGRENTMNCHKPLQSQSLEAILMGTHRTPSWIHYASLCPNLHKNELRLQCQQQQQNLLTS